MSQHGKDGDRNIVQESPSNEIPWTDDRIRWDDVVSEDDHQNVGQDNNDEDETAWRDPFQSEDLTEIFTRRYALSKPGPAESETTTTTNSIIEVQLQGYQAEADEIWKSTGLTLWRASDYLCEYMIAHPQMLWRSNGNSSILELGAGLGLVGIVAHRMLLASSPLSDWNAPHHNHTSRVILTDGDTDTLRQLRVNLERNNHRPAIQSPRLECRQLLWGRETALQFQRELQQRQEQEQHSGTTFDLILASDIIYAASIVDPLWETIQVLLSKPTTTPPKVSLDAADGADGATTNNSPPPPCFVLAFAQRRVPVSIDTVLEAAVQHGFTYQLVQEDPTGIFIYVFQWSGEPPSAAQQLRQHPHSVGNERSLDGDIELFF